MRKIYFVGSIRGGRTDAGLYKRLIDYLKKKCVVLTEHVGSENVIFEERDKTDSDIYNQDTTWLKECDVLIGECTCPSLGVGYELAYAEKIGKPCHLFYNKTKVKLSALLTGNTYFHIYPYEQEEEIYTMLDELLKE